MADEAGGGWIFLQQNLAQKRVGWSDPILSHPADAFSTCHNPPLLPKLPQNASLVAHYLTWQTRLVEAEYFYSKFSTKRNGILSASRTISTKLIKFHSGSLLQVPTHKTN
jgi:hypothetical protein